MLELAADLRLLDEPPDQAVVAGLAGMEYLDRDVSAEVGVASFEDDSHPAAADLAEDLVAHLPAGGKGVLSGPDHWRGRVRLIAQQDPRRDARGLPEGLQDTVPAPRRRLSTTGPKAARRPASMSASGSSSAGVRSGMDVVVHGDCPSQFFGPYSWFSAWAVFAQDFSGSGENFSADSDSVVDSRDWACGYSSSERS